MKKIFLVLVLFLIALQIVGTSQQAQARTSRRHLRIVQKLNPLTGPPVTTFSYNTRNHHFSLMVRPLLPGSRLTYTIAYTKQGSDIQEALQGSRRITRTKTFSITPYAGSQSSRYFISHFVTGGSLDISGTDLQGNPYTFHENFTIQGRKFVVTSS